MSVHDSVTIIEIDIANECQIPSHHYDIDDELRQYISEVISNSTRAISIRSQERKQRLKYISNCVAELFETPGGITVAELLSTAESEDLSSTVRSINAYLKNGKHSDYKLKRKRVKGETKYQLIFKTDNQ